MIRGRRSASKYALLSFACCYSTFFFLPCKRFIKFFITPLSKLARIGLEAAVIAMIEVLTSTGPLGTHFSMKVLGSYKVMQVLPSSLKR